MSVRCVIVGAGDYSPGDLPRRAEGDLVIAADAGYSHIVREGEKPDVFIGDCDSLGGAPAGIDSVILPRRKDDTDTVAAVKYALERGYTDFLLLGCTGGKRMSHTLANLQTLAFIKSNGANGKIKCGGTEAVFVTAGEEYFIGGECEFFSVFASGTAKVNVTGALFDATEAVITSSFPIGVSNEPSGKACVEVLSGAVYIITE